MVRTINKLGRTAGETRLGVGTVHMGTSMQEGGMRL